MCCFCRWNYKDEPDAFAVDAGFDIHSIPYDVLWLDIEHTQGKRCVEVLHGLAGRNCSSGHSFLLWDFQSNGSPSVLKSLRSRVHRSLYANLSVCLCVCLPICLSACLGIPWHVRRYMTWDAHAFPHPLEMQLDIASRGRKMVTIVDPHVKRDYSYYIHKEASDKKFYVKQKDGSDFDGWCWPGEAPT